MSFKTCYNISGKCMCLAAGDPNYKTYDGGVLHFHGKCTYLLTDAWEGDFCRMKVVVKNAECRNPKFAYTQTVYIIMRYYDFEDILVFDKKTMTITVSVIQV